MTGMCDCVWCCGIDCLDDFIIITLGHDIILHDIILLGECVVSDRDNHRERGGPFHILHHRIVRE